MSNTELTVLDFMELLVHYTYHSLWLMKKMAIATVRPRHLPVVTILLMMMMFYSIFLSHVDPETLVEIMPREVVVEPYYTKKYAQIEDVPAPRVENLNCHRLFHDDQSRERAIATQYQKYRNLTNSIGARELIDWTSNCEKFRSDRKYIMKPVSPEEEDFGIAYSLLMYKDAGQVERLLRAIYRPTNYYCIHVDVKSPPIIHQSMRQLASCFDNVIIARKSSDVAWGFYTVVEPEMTCMEDLWKFKKWKYLINLTGQEFPLKTNLDLIKIMKIYDGANDIPGVSLARLPGRFMERVQYIRTPDTPLENRTRKSEFPLMLNFTKGTVHITASRAYIDFLLHNPISQALRYWMNDTFVPDETYFSSLNQNPRLKMPGGYLGGEAMSAFTINRYKMWRHTGPCKGKFVRYICIPGLGDLPALGQSRELFLNKMEDDYQHFAYDCLEELHFNRTREDILGINRIKSTYYEKLPFVVHARRDIRDSRDWTLTDAELEDWRLATIEERAEMRRLEELAKINITNGTNVAAHIHDEEELQHVHPVKAAAAAVPDKQKDKPPTNGRVKQHGNGPSAMKSQKSNASKTKNLISAKSKSKQQQQRQQQQPKDSKQNNVGKSKTKQNNSKVKGSKKR